MERNVILIKEYNNNFKVYHSPQLTTFGLVEDLTRGGDGEIFEAPANYSAFTPAK